MPAPPPEDVFGDLFMLLLGNPQNNLIAGAARLREAKASVTLNVNNTTGSKVVFTITGSVMVFGLWGEVTTVISANHTAGHFRLNDQTATIDITEAATGIALSGLAAGTLFYKESLAAVALKLKDNAAGAFEEPASAGQPAFTPFVAIKKTGAVTTIDYRYTTTDAPSSGVVKFHALWLPMSDDGNLS